MSLSKHEECDYQARSARKFGSNIENMARQNFCGIVVAAAAVVGAGASLYSATKKSGQAADAQVEAAQQAGNDQLEMFYTSRADQLPWLEKGAEAVGQLPGMIEEGPGAFEESPYYQLGLDEQQRATDAYMGSRGLYASGAAAEQLQENALTNMQLNRGNWLNEWISTKLNPTQALSGTGQTTASNIAGNAMTTGANVAGTTMAAGQARATGYINQANALTGAVQTGANALGTYYGNQPQQPAWQPTYAPSPSAYGPTTPIAQPGPVHVGAGGTTAFGM